MCFEAIKDIYASDTCSVQCHWSIRNPFQTTNIDSSLFFVNEVYNFFGYNYTTISIGVVSLKYIIFLSMKYGIRCRLILFGWPESCKIKENLGVHSNISSLQLQLRCKKRLSFARFFLQDIMMDCTKIGKNKSFISQSYNYESLEHNINRKNFTRKSERFWSDEIFSWEIADRNEIPSVWKIADSMFETWGSWKTTICLF